MTSPPPDAARYAVLVPVKRPALAKSRLGDLGESRRQELAAAFAADTVSAVLACAQVSRVLVVTDDHELARAMLDRGVEVMPDGTADLNGTLVQAAAEMHRRDPTLRIAALCADLPALRPDELTLALAAADPSRMSFVSDEQRVGTTAVLAPGIEEFGPAFGHGSRHQHLAAGAFEVEGIDVPGLRRDVDDPADLAEAIRLGVGPRTAFVATGLVLEVAGTATVQATVAAFDAETRSGRVVLDDGTTVRFTATALEGSGLLRLRPGQRVRLETRGTGRDLRVDRLAIVTMGRH